MLFAITKHAWFGTMDFLIVRLNIKILFVMVVIIC